MTYLFAGLGNPGNEYLKTRHNIGFHSLDYILSHLFENAEFKNENKFSAETSAVQFKSNKIIFAKPQTFMNLSGKSILSIKNFYKPDNIIIIHDDLDLDFGKIKLSENSSDDGHNGLKSITSAIGNNYMKIRIGISRPKLMNPVKYVLSPFSDDELENLEKVLLPKVTSIFTTIATDGWIKAQNKWNKK